MKALPTELWLIVIELLHGDRKAVAALALSCANLARLTRPARLHDIQLRSCQNSLHFAARLPSDHGAWEARLQFALSANSAPCVRRVYFRGHGTRRLGEGISAPRHPHRTGPVAPCSIIPTFLRSLTQFTRMHTIFFEKVHLDTAALRLLYAAHPTLRSIHFASNCTAAVLDLNALAPTIILQQLSVLSTPQRDQNLSMPLWAPFLYDTASQITELYLTISPDHWLAHIGDIAVNRHLETLHFIWWPEDRASNILLLTKFPNIRALSLGSIDSEIPGALGLGSQFMPPAPPLDLPLLAHLILDPKNVPLLELFAPLPSLTALTLHAWDVLYSHRLLQHSPAFHALFPRLRYLDARLVGLNRTSGPWQPAPQLGVLLRASTGLRHLRLFWQLGRSRLAEFYESIPDMLPTTLHTLAVAQPPGAWREGPERTVTRAGTGSAPAARTDSALCTAITAHCPTLAGLWLEAADSGPDGTLIWERSPSTGEEAQAVHKSAGNLNRAFMDNWWRGQTRDTRMVVDPFNH